MEDPSKKFSPRSTLGKKQPSLDVESTTTSNAIEIPEISLPKGGGALKGIDEKFEVNAANGTAGFTLPLPISPARNGFNPSLSIGYNSGSGNGPFGLGWALSLPSIKIKSDKKLPQYRHDVEDVFMLSGVEDLVPLLDKTEEDQWTPRQENFQDYTIEVYRPRIEGSFARIEKVSHPSHGVYWKVTSRDNVVTFYGKSEGRIADPENQSRIFEWLPEFSHDDKGNWIHYEYKRDTNFDGHNVIPMQFSYSAGEAHRHNGLATFTNTYLKKVKYGNRYPYYANPNNPYSLVFPENQECFFELVFDYGEHDQYKPTPQEVQSWNYREDAFSIYRPGFEIRTSRLCQRILMFHHFPNETQFTGTAEEENFGENYLVASLDLKYSPSSINHSGQAEVTYLSSAIQQGYIRKLGGDYAKKSFPPIEFSYQSLQWNLSMKTVNEESLEGAPSGLASNYHWVDLYGEGLSGILTEQGEGWFYKSNWGDVDGKGEAYFTPAKQVLSRPSISGLSAADLSLQDLEGNGEKQWVVNTENLKGYYEWGQGEVDSFHPFEQQININLRDPHIRMIDLDGDGSPELVLSESNAFLWYTANGKKGYGQAIRSYLAESEEEGPRVIFADQEQTIFLADMSGDGLTDIVRINDGSICYWPNLGYGKFGAKITMDNAPRFDYPGLFNPDYIRLADVSGTGATDMIYLAKDVFKVYINLSGNAWSNAHEIDPAFPVDSNAKLSVVDLLGTGTSCIVWSSALPDYAQASMRYIDLMDSRKPHVMTGYKNNLGKETSVEYKSSTYYYIKDKLAGTPWITKIPFPVQLISKITVEEKITGVKFSSTYSYHHGYYDHPEKEFRGFGRVEQVDTEFYPEWHKANEGNKLEKDEAFYQKPILTKTWFHVGAWSDQEKMLAQYKAEFWMAHYSHQFSNAPLSVDEPEIPPMVLSDDINKLPVDQYREALRAFKGMTLRQEVFALDGNPTDVGTMHQQFKPYRVAIHTGYLQLIQPRDKNPYGVVLLTEGEVVTFHYERNEMDPRVTHHLNIKVNEIGQVLESASVVYPRKQVDVELPLNIQEKQSLTLITYSRKTYTNDVIIPEAYRLRTVMQTEIFEITGLYPSNNLFRKEEFENILILGSVEIPYHQSLAPNGIHRRLIEHVKVRYRSDDATTALPFGTLESKGLAYENYQLAFTPDLLQFVFGDKLPSDPLELEQLLGDQATGNFSSQGKYVHLDDDNWWIRSGTIQFKESEETIMDVKKRFYMPLSYTDPLGAITSISYWKDYYLFIESTTDMVGSQVKVERINFRILSPVRLRDINDNVSEVLVDELGLVKAMAVMGKGNEGDSLAGLKEVTSANEQELIKTYFTLSETTALRVTAQQLLQRATFRMVYDADRYQLSEQLRHEQLENHPNTLPCAYINLLPAVTGGITREQHYIINPKSPLQLSFEYSDGNGNIAMAKTQAEPGEALRLNIQPDCTYGVETVNTGDQLRWIGNGRTILNNKGAPVKQYEPYFSITPFYEDAKALVERGVTPIMHYDALGRNIRTELPDGTFTKTIFDPWKQTRYDQNDTVKESAWYSNRGSPDPNAISPADPEQQAAWKAAHHFNTPSTSHVDVMGRPVYTVSHNRVGGVDEYYATTVHLDIEGNARSVVDSRNNTVMIYHYDMLGNRVYEKSMDAGERWMMNNIAGNPLRSWDSRGHIFTTLYDVLQRPLENHVQGGDGQIPLDHVIAKFIYGEGQLNDKLNNLRGQAVEHFDTAGKITNVKFDFKGNLLQANRKMIADYKHTPSWSGTTPDSLLESEVFTASSSYDALNRVILATAADGSLTTPVYNEAGLLKQMYVQMFSIDNNTNSPVHTFVQHIHYDEKGQRKSILYGNNVQTTYTYDSKTFRLTRLISKKQNNELLQDLRYTYDPCGNISEIEDMAIPTVFFGNHEIDAKTEYTYDALYRLIQAKGREHIAQVDFGGEDNWKDLPFLKKYSANDPMAWRSYTQNYQYDSVGNLLRMKHQASGGNWTRNYKYETASNRLVHTLVGNSTYSYPHHETHGFITQLPHLAGLAWNFNDEVKSIARQVINNGVPETTYYVYDGNGERVRKVTENEGGMSKKEERIYLAGVEIHRKHSGANNGLERVSFHVMDNTQRIAIVDTRNEVNDGTDRRTLRYQLNNHLGSASLELTDGSSPSVISYEEYHPYGTTSYQAVNKDIKVTAKRYRYTGMERDNETGLSYHSARYYISWLGRWLSNDPIGIGDGVNVYQYASGNPVMGSDPTGTQTAAICYQSEENPALLDCVPVEEEPTSQETPAIIDVYVFGPPRKKHAAAPSEETTEPASEGALDLNLDISLDVEGLMFDLRMQQFEADMVNVLRYTQSYEYRLAFAQNLYFQNLKPERSFWNRGGGSLVGGGAAAGVGIAILASNPVGWVAMATGALLIAGGVVGTSTGAIQLGGSYGGFTSYEQDMQMNQAIGTTLSLSSIGGLGGGITGLLITGDESGLETGAMYGGLAEGGLSLSYGMSTMAWREYRFSQLYGKGSYSWQYSKRLKPSIRQAYGMEASAERRTNSLFNWMGQPVEFKELSHFIPRRSGYPSLLNRPWNVKPMWGTQHALIDSYRWNPMTSQFKSVYGGFRITGPTRYLQLAPDWMQYSAYGVSQIGISGSF